MQFNFDTEKNDISHVRFGGLGAAGSETWVRGSKMKPYQVKKLEELLRFVKGEAEPEVKPQNDENLQNMFD